MITLSDIRWACGSDLPVLFDPGELAVTELFLLKRGRPVVGKCLACWAIVGAVIVDAPI